MLDISENRFVYASSIEKPSRPFDSNNFFNFQLGTYKPFLGGAPPTPNPQVGTGHSSTSSSSLSISRVLRTDVTAQTIRPRDIKRLAIEKTLEFIFGFFFFYYPVKHYYNSTGPYKHTTCTVLYSVCMGTFCSSTTTEF